MKPVAVLLGVACSSIGALFPAYGEAGQPHGYWQGAVVRDGSVLPLSLYFDPADQGATVEIDVPSMGTCGRRAEVTSGPEGITIPFGSFEFRLRVDAASADLRGELAVRNRSSAWTGAVELLRVARPPGHEVIEEPTRFSSADGVELSGRIVLPEGEGVHPGVVFVQGRSYGEGRQHRSHAVAAARRGFAAVYFDGRGAGGSGGIRGEHTLANRLDDAEAALRHLRGHPRVDAERVGMFGHSAGGWVVPVVAQRAGSVAFLILHAGPAESLADQQGHVVQEIARRTGEFVEDELEEMFRYQRRLVELVGGGAAWPAIAAHVEASAGKSWSARVDRPDDEQDAEVGYFRRNPHDNVAALRATTVPLLAIYGADDYVVPSRFNVPKLEEHLRIAGNDRHEIVVFPGAGHDLYRTRDRSAPSPFPWPRRPPGYLDRILDWMRDAVR